LRHPSTYAGRVVAFDEAVGLGEVVVSSGLGGGPGAGPGAGPERLGFHCTQIADGSRSIEVGAEVTFYLMAGRLGRWEAGGVTPGR
jgi:hypothetical protein